MRLKVTLSAKELRVPKQYQHALQGMIYHMLDPENTGGWLHEHGYQGNLRSYKLFVFSNLSGRSRLENQELIFNGKTCLFISAQHPEILSELYQTMLKNGCLSLNHQTVPIYRIEIQELPYFKGEKEVWIRTLSGATAYRSHEKKFEYFLPDSREFYEICLQNLTDKNSAQKVPYPSLTFQIEEVRDVRKRIVHIKNTFYVAYSCRMKLLVNYAALSLLYNTGLASKGPSGFGMIELDPDETERRV